MRQYGILLETPDGVRTRSWLPYKSNAEAIVDWLGRSEGLRVEIVSNRRIVARWDNRRISGIAA
jgi:hypothetical protein